MHNQTGLWKKLLVILNAIENLYQAKLAEQRIIVSVGNVEEEEKDASRKCHSK